MSVDCDQRFPGEGPLLLYDHALLTQSGVDNKRAGGPSAAREARDTPQRCRRGWLSLELEARARDNERVRPSITCVAFTSRSVMALSNFDEREVMRRGEFYVLPGRLERHLCRPWASAP